MGHFPLALLTATQLLISSHMQWIVRARNMLINRSSVSAIARAVFIGEFDL